MALATIFIMSVGSVSAAPVSVHCQFIDVDNEAIQNADVNIQLRDATNTTIYNQTFIDVTDVRGVCQNIVVDAPVVYGDVYSMRLSADGVLYEVNGSEYAMFTAWFGDIDASVDEADDYTWTGTHDYSGATVSGLSGFVTGVGDVGSTVRLGNSVIASGARGIAIGENSRATTSNTVGIGAAAWANHANSLVLYSGSDLDTGVFTSTSTEQFRVGTVISSSPFELFMANTTGAYSLGDKLATEDYVTANAGGVDEAANYTWTGTQDFTSANVVNLVKGHTENSGIRIGRTTVQLDSTGTGTIAITTDAVLTGANNVFVGQSQGNANTQDMTVVGHAARGGGQGSTAFGRLARAQGADSIAIGRTAIVNADVTTDGIAIGRGAVINNFSPRGIVLGATSSIAGFVNDAVVIGRGSSVSANDAIAIGRQVTNSEASSFLVGQGANHWLRANTTGVYAMGDKLATEDYVIANAGGVDEAADYTWTGLQNFAGATVTGLNTYHQPQSIPFSSSWYSIDWTDGADVRFANGFIGLGRTFRYCNGLTEVIPTSANYRTVRLIFSNRNDLGASSVVKTQVTNCDDIQEVRGDTATVNIPVGGVYIVELTLVPVTGIGKVVMVKDILVP